MDDVTVAAIRAVVRGLYHAKVLGEEQILSIMGELQDEAKQRLDAHYTVEGNQLMQLASVIGQDARVGD